MVRSLAFLSAVGLVALCSDVRAAEDQPKDVIAQAIKAHGGEEVMTKNKAGTSSGKGKITIPGVGDVEFTQESAHMMPDKFKESLQMSIAGQTISVLTLVDGDKTTIEANGAAVDLDDATKESLANVGHILKLGKLVSLLSDKSLELSLIGEEKVEGKPAIGIRVTSKGKKDINMFFDKKTHLISKIEFRTLDPFTKNEVNEERIVAEYSTSKDGLPVPKKMIVKHDSKTFLEIELSDVQLLEKLDDSHFKK